MIGKLRKLLDWALLEDLTLNFNLLQYKDKRKGYNYIALSIKRRFINALIKILKEVLY